jgi:peroxiredoxin (alkyl hydroperoxide reductase subunit C)
MASSLSRKSLTGPSPASGRKIYFYPKDITFICRTEIVEFAKPAKDFEDRDAVLLGGSVDNEFVKVA